MIIIDHTHISRHTYQCLVLPDAPRYWRDHLQLILRHQNIKYTSQKRLQFSRNICYLVRYTYLNRKRSQSPSAEEGGLHILSNTLFADFRTATSKVHCAPVIALRRPPKVNVNYSWGPSINCDRLQAALHFLWAGGLFQSLAKEGKNDPSKLHN